MSLWSVSFIFLFNRFSLIVFSNLKLSVQHFLRSTKKMEGDGPTGASVLFQYSGLISVLADIKQTTQHQGISEMITRMITQLRDYQTEALHCDPIVMAAVLNPRLRLEYFNNKYPDYANRAEELFRLKFSEYANNCPDLSSKPTSSADTEAEQFDPLDESNVFGASSAKTLTSDEELDQYLSGMRPCERDMDILQWWRVSSLFCPSLCIEILLLTLYLSFR